MGVGIFNTMEDELQVAVHGIFNTMEDKLQDAVVDNMNDDCHCAFCTIQ